MRTTDRTPQTVTQILDILRALYAEFPVYESKIVVNNVTLYTTQEVYNEFEKYYTFFFCPSLTVLSATQTFKDKWANYIGIQGENLKRMYDALYSQYNPIENYSLSESGLDGMRKDKETETATPTGKTTVDSTQKGTMQTDSYISGLASTGNGSHSETQIATPTQYGTTTETSYTNAKTEVETQPANTMTGDFDGTTHTGYHEAREHFFTRSGNIGTMTPADMIMKEYTARKIDLLRGFVKAFINEYCFYVS